MSAERPALVRQHMDRTPPGLLGTWAQERGIAYEVHRTWTGEAEPELAGRPWVASLGSPNSPRDADVPAVVAELAAVRAAVEQEVPVLGLCYGGQVLAAVLGGTVEAAERPEVGWHEIESDVPDELPAGPWLQWHFQRFSVPPGAIELARSASGPQAFRSGDHLGVQFHPESTIEIVTHWARADRDRVHERGLGDSEALVEAGRHLAPAAARNAFVLFDAFLEHIRIHSAGRAAA